MMACGVALWKEFIVISPALVELLTSLNLSLDGIQKSVKIALDEDLAGGVDLTSSATITENQTSTALFKARESGRVSGIAAAAVVLELCGITEYILLVKDGDVINSGDVIISCTGNTRSILLAERTALNFLCHLSGISTLTAKWVDQVSKTSTKIRDTRKTTPGLRELEKFAVRMGGGVNHRMSLSDSVLIKDNHIAAAGGVVLAFTAVRAKFAMAMTKIEVEVEVDNLKQLREVIEAGADLVLLDNMTIEECRSAVNIAKGKAKLEASGGLSLINAAAYAATGVDYLAVGALTHSARILDIGLDF